MRSSDYMSCPKCSATQSNVVDSRRGKSYDARRRRRECLHCGHRFTTIEHVINSRRPKAPSRATLERLAHIEKQLRLTTIRLQTLTEDTKAIYDKIEPLLPPKRRASASETSLRDFKKQRSAKGVNCLGGGVG